MDKPIPLAMAKFLLFVLTLTLVTASTGGRALAAGWNDDDLPQRQKAMKEAVRVMSRFKAETMDAEPVRRAMAFVNAELDHLRPIAQAVHRMPENTAAEIRAKKAARAASQELLTRHLSKLLPGGSVKIRVQDL